MLPRIFAMILVLAAAGCASVNPVPFTGPSGRQGLDGHGLGVGQAREG